MEEKDLSDWKSFQVELQSLRTRLKGHDLLFRGVPNSEWHLTTTLERSGFDEMSFYAYYLVTNRIKPALETLTGVEWGALEHSLELFESFHNPELLTLPGFPPVPLYRYWVYLRHHGFPSPLLDWSRSAFVAAFFAFRSPTAAAPKRSIYVYCESPTGVKGGAIGAPTIHPIGPYVRSHPRHFRQQSDYTICAKLDQSEGWQFHRHELVFGGGHKQQDLLWKFNVPSSERVNVLRSLDEHNLNAFSLFDSEEALLETLWSRELIFKGYLAGYKPTKLEDLGEI